MNSVTLSAGNILWQLGTHPLLRSAIASILEAMKESRDQQSDVIFIIWHLNHVFSISFPEKQHVYFAPFVKYDLRFRMPAHPRMMTLLAVAEWQKSGVFNAQFCTKCAVLKLYAQL